MIHLVYGKDKFRVDEYVKKIISKDKDGLNTATFDSMSGYAGIINEVMAVPFLGDQRIVVVRNILKSKDKESMDSLLKALELVPASTELIFREDEDPDQRLAVTKKLRACATVQVFQDLAPAEISKYIQETVKERGGEIDVRTATLLSSFVGADLMRLNNEISKLLSYNKVITSESVTSLVDAGYFNSIFDLTDAVGQKNSKAALGHLEKLLSSGENELYLVSMIVMQVRNLLLVTDLSSHHLTQQEIASKAKLHPYVVQKALAQVKRFSLPQLISLHRDLLDIDIAAKTSSGEPRTMLEQIIVKSSK